MARTGRQSAPSETLDLFVPAPEEIGPIRSAHSSLRPTQKPKSLGLRLLIGTLVGVLPALLVAAGLFFGLGESVETCAFLFVAIAIVVTPVAIAGTLYFTRFRHYCGYVGETGVAYFTCAGSRENAKVRQVLSFPDARDLRVATTRHYSDSTYEHTSYDYSWSDEADRSVFRLDGTYSSEHEPPSPGDKYHLAVEAEKAWSDYLLEGILTRLRDGKPYSFRLQGRDEITFHEGHLELSLRGKGQRFYPGDLTEVRVKDGTITLKEPGAKEGWFTSTGVHHFSFAELANARLFLTLVEQMYDVSTDA